MSAPDPILVELDRLRDDLDVKVSRSTVARWISALDEPTEAAS